MTKLRFDCTVIDETIIPFQGRCRFKVHIRGKPHSDGLKMFGIADCESYLYCFFFFQKDDTDGPRKTLDVVNALAKSLPSNFSHLIVADSYYGGLDTAMAMNSLGVTVPFQLFR